MGKRIKVGIVYSYDENWIGGTYYYQYLIQSLNLLPNDKKPHLVILSKKKSSFESVKKLRYPYISYQLLANNLTFKIKLKNFILNSFSEVKRQFKEHINFNIDVIFHPSELELPTQVKKRLYWIPDFQEHYLPHLFSEEHYDYRKSSQKKLLAKDEHVLFSSEDAKRDFYDIYPKAECYTYVTNFAVFHPKKWDLDLQTLKSKYGLPDGKYFFCANQFWKHKNHLVVLKAIRYMKDLYKIEPLVCFTGKEHDIRNPTYFKSLKEYVKKNDLTENARFLGFIDRDEQLSLMKNAEAIIQPSLFEGWSSVVEDAKAMNQNIIVSSLDVHKEQLGENGYYFNPEHLEELSDKMHLFLKNTVSKPKFNYSKNQSDFGIQFMEVIKNVLK